MPGMKSSLVETMPMVCNCSRLCCIAQNPVRLLLRIRHRFAASRFNGLQRRLGLPTQMNEDAGRNDGGPAYAAPAMDANRFPAAESICQSGYKVTEGIRIHRNMRVGKRIRKKIHSDMHGSRAFVRQAK